MKLISNAKECGYRNLVRTRLGIYIGYNCLNPKNEGKDCTPNTGFPTNCPLHDGQPVPKSIEELIVLVEQEREKIRNSNVLKPERRNRKDCIHFEKPIGIPKSCNKAGLPNFCQGVTCTYFKTK